MVGTKRRLTGVVTGAGAPETFPMGMLNNSFYPKGVSFADILHSDRTWQASLPVLSPFECSPPEHAKGHVPALPSV